MYLTQFLPVRGELHPQCSLRKQVFLAPLLPPLSFARSFQGAGTDSVSLGGSPW